MKKVFFIVGFLFFCVQVGVSQIRLSSFESDVDKFWPDIQDSFAILLGLAGAGFLTITAWKFFIGEESEAKKWQLISGLIGIILFAILKTI